LYQCIRNTDVIEQINSGHSQSNEDIWLWEKIFSKLPRSEIQGGRFVEIGAFDGSTYSNSWFFEQNLDWRGLLIEGHPHNGPKLIENVEHFRLNSVAVYFS
jgi:hypothetical protein